MPSIIEHTLRLHEAEAPARLPHPAVVAGK